MINPYIILAVVLAFIANGFYWNHHGDSKGYSRAVAEYNVKLLAATNAARVKEQSMQAKLQEAQNAAIQRDQTIRTAAEGWQDCRGLHATAPMEQGANCWRCRGLAGTDEAAKG